MGGPGLLNGVVRAYLDWTQDVRVDFMGVEQNGHMAVRFCSWEAEGM